MKFIWLIILLICSYSFRLEAQTPNTTDSLLGILNSAIANKEFYVKSKQDHINKLKNQVSNAKTLNEKYTLYEALYEQYKSFRYDSSYLYSKLLLAKSIDLNDPLMIARAKMKLSFTLLSSGLFKETLDELASIHLLALQEKDKSDYYFLKARTYFDLADYNRNPDYTAIYDPLGISLIDSALRFSSPGTSNYLELKGLKDLRTGNKAEGRETYLSLLKLPALSSHQFAVNACCLAYIYKVSGEKEKSEDLLIKAAISDIESATKETVACYQVADILFRKGDIQHSYLYIKQAMEDATFYGALQRQVKISSILPIIEAQWINQIEHQKRILYLYSFIITLLVLFVIAFAFIIFRQLKKLRIADDLIKTANISLQQSNEALENLNINLGTANKIKNEYIGYYFNINSVYIEKLESFKNSLDKKLSNKRYEDALSTVKNINLENERHELFHTFDNIFLRLFPDFINKFNTLFPPDGSIHVPEGQLLSTEHRIFALIRMGIHDNDRIAKLLGYSVNTIYSYKNRIKNKSFIANDEFEDRIMEIEAV